MSAARRLYPPKRGRILRLEPELSEKGHKQTSIVLQDRAKITMAEPLKHEEPRPFQGGSPSRCQVQAPRGDGGGQGARADRQQPTR